MFRRFERAAARAAHMLRRHAPAAAALAAVGAVGLYVPTQASGSSAPSAPVGGSGRTSWPIYTRKDVATHKTKASGIWVTHGDGVYDVTSFVEKHPGA